VTSVESGHNKKERKHHMKERMILVGQIVAALLLFGGSSFLANLWKLEGSNYSVAKKTDGEIARNSMVAVAESNAQFKRDQAESSAEKDKEIILAVANATAKKIEAQADTVRVKLNNESTEAQVEALRAIYGRQRSSSTGNEGGRVAPQPDAFEDVRGPKLTKSPSNIPEASSFEHLLKKQRTDQKQEDYPGVQVPNPFKAKNSSAIDEGARYVPAEPDAFEDAKGTKKATRPSKLPASSSKSLWNQPEAGSSKSLWNQPEAGSSKSLWNRAKDPKKKDPLDKY
jgi:hypothetical protein